MGVLFPFSQFLYPALFKGVLGSESRTVGLLVSPAVDWEKKKYYI